MNKRPNLGKSFPYTKCRGASEFRLSLHIMSSLQVLILAPRLPQDSPFPHLGSFTIRDDQSQCMHNRQWRDRGYQHLHFQPGVRQTAYGCCSRTSVLSPGPFCRRWWGRLFRWQGSCPFPGMHRCCPVSLWTEQESRLEQPGKEACRLDTSEHF